MGVIDKLKNALFEVEYVEVEEPPKKEKKVKEKPKPKEIKVEKPIAKKIVLPGKKEEKVEEIEEEELLDEDFEIRPKDETIKEEVKDSFKLMDDDDFKVDEDDSFEEPEIIEAPKPVREEYREPVVEQKPIYYQESHVDSRESKPYGMDNSYNVPVHQYGTYERHEERTYFKPSPIISPIYGILDKNYKKEDVKEKKEVSLSYSRGKLSVDDIRNKAYGREEEKTVEEEPVEEVEAIDEDNLMVDLSDRAKPEVKEITVGDALEYFQDLGLEYNVDYVDASGDKKPQPEKKEEKVEKVEEKPVKEEIKEKVEEKHEEEKENSDDDNLFDLIDSMYQENN